MFVLDKYLGPGANLGFKAHFDSGTGYIYSDGGAVNGPASASHVGDFAASGIMAPDSKLGLAYFLGQTANQNNYGQNSTSYTLQIFDLTHFTLLNSIVIPNVIGTPVKLVRWGASGVAFITENGDLENNNAPNLTYLLSGPAITNTAPATPNAEHVRLTRKPGPQRHTPHAALP